MWDCEEVWGVKTKKSSVTGLVLIVPKQSVATLPYNKSYRQRHRLTALLPLLPTLKIVYYV